jgi:hypothetical protein
MSDSDAKKIVRPGDHRSAALDHMTVAGAERALRNKTANLSVAGAAARLTSVTTPVSQGTQRPMASTTTPAVPRSSKQK